MSLGLTKEQEDAFQKFRERKSMCLTGPAGCGKSFLISYIRKYCNEHKIEIAVTALTGAAACLISGQTLHRWAGIGLAKADAVTLSNYIIRKNSEARNRWRSVSVLIIDEVSMMSAELFNKLNIIAQKVRNTNLFFGGIKVIFAGDFAQLEPIGADKFCFEASEWQRHVQPNTVYIDKVIRQSEPEFLKVLQEIRLGRVTLETKKILDARIISNESEADVEILGVKQRVKATLLYPHKKDVENVNTTELNKLITAGYEANKYHASNTVLVKKTSTIRDITSSEIEQLNKVVTVADQLNLTVGAQVMLVINLDFDKGLVNGSRGVVTKVGPEPTVIFDNGCEEVIERCYFESDTGNTILRRLQFPLILAWALTIHKCQGATLTNVITDLRKVFCNGQSYVTLSRVKSLEGLFLLGINYQAIKCNPKVKRYYQELLLEKNN